MKPFRIIITAFLSICICGILIAATENPEDQTEVSDDTSNVPLGGSWQKNITDDGIQHDNSIGHSKAGFVVHTIGNTSKPLSYAFYVITEPHIGDLVAPCDDYNRPGWSPYLRKHRRMRWSYDREIP